MFRRADSTTLYSGGHVGTRGSLSSIKELGSGELDQELSYEEEIWEQQVRRAMMTVEAGLTSYDNDFEESSDFEILQILNIYGKYESNYNPQFNEKFFTPADH